MTHAIRSYLRKYAEPEVYLAESINPGTHDYALVVPAYDESPGFVEQLLENQTENLLLILVANAAQSGHTRTLELIRHIQTYPRLAQNAHLSTHRFKHDQTILLVDRVSDDRTIPAAKGVGLARKIGADLATSLISRHLVSSPWIFNTDADVRLPRDYFRSSGDSKGAALLYPYEHSAPAQLNTHVALYNLFLDYYVEGLRMAGSHYAFHTIGSTMAVNHESYAQVRGFPKRPAAEDFYLLNKLAKVGDVTELDQPVIHITARLSRRTPFGTGQALWKIDALTDPLMEIRHYNPKVFACLGFWLKSFPGFWDTALADPNPLFSDAGEFQAPLADYYRSHDIDSIIRKGLGQYRSKHTFLNYLTQWFDAFRTLKFVHYMRDHYFASVTTDILSEMLRSSDIDPLIAMQVDRILTT